MTCEEKNDYREDSKKAGNEKNCRISEISSCWLNEASLDLKESSVVKYRNILENYVLPAFGEKELSEIDNEELMAFIEDLRRNGGAGNHGLAASTVSEIVTTLNSIRKYAIRRGRPAGFDPACVRIKHETREIRVFSMNEEQRLISYIMEHLDLTGLGILLCLYTGIRIGELCALKWDCIDLEASTIKIGKTMQRLRVDGCLKKTEVKILEPKSSHSVRVIPLPDKLVTVLREWRVPGAFLLTGDKELFVEPRVMQKRFKRILRNCGIADANFHATRHSFATRCVESGFDIKSLSEILGHSGVNITLNRYVHPTMELKARNMNLLAEMLEG